MPGRAVVGIIAVGIAVASCSTEAVGPAAPRPTPQGPSQTKAEARRDGVPAKVAAMTLSFRLRLREAGSPSITTDEGVWAIARPEVVPEYGEVLLLDARREKVVKAFPLPGAPPYHLAITEDALYCGRAGDGALPNTSVCRIDRDTRKMAVRIFWCVDCVDATPEPEPRKGWSVTRGALEMYALDADDDGVWSKESQHGVAWTQLDALTLDTLRKGVVRATPTPS